MTRTEGVARKGKRKKRNDWGRKRKKMHPKLEQGKNDLHESPVMLNCSCERPLALGFSKILLVVKFSVV